MNKIIALAFLTLSAQAMADEYVNGYTRKDGTYVAPHMRSSPNNQQWDNYSTKGNINPYTGQKGAEQDNIYSAPKPTPYHLRRSSY